MKQTEILHKQKQSRESSQNFIVCDPTRMDFSTNVNVKTESEKIKLIFFLCISEQRDISIKHKRIRKKEKTRANMVFVGDF